MYRTSRPSFNSSRPAYLSDSLHRDGSGITLSTSCDGSFSIISYVIPRWEGAIRCRFTWLEEAESGGFETDSR